VPGFNTPEPVFWLSSATVRLWPARLLTIPSCGVRFRTQRTCYRVCCISVGAARCQPEKNASPGGQRIYATQEIAHDVAKGGLIMLIQCVQ